MIWRDIITNTKLQNVKTGLFKKDEASTVSFSFANYLSDGKYTVDVAEILGRVNENRSKISVSTESREEADRIFTGLTVGGTIEMPIADSPWSSYFGMFRDKFGIEWTVEFDRDNKR